MGGTEPRGKLSIWLLGLIFGPVVLMLWLGRGRLALIYLVVTLLLVGALFLAVAGGLIAPPAWIDLDAASMLFYLPLNIVGLVHGLKIRNIALARPWFSRWYAAIILPIAASWLIAFGIRAFLYQPFNVPSASMVPGLMVGDHFFMSKIAYGEPRRGDIVVFKLPRDNQTDYVKRLIGLPGDRIQVKDGIVHLNGAALPLAPVEGIACMEGDQCHFFRETLPDGRSYVINDLTPNGSADNTVEYVVPDGHYFMMGDNRDNALDSRYLDQVGYVPRANMQGPAVLIFWNSMGLRVDDRLQGYPGR
ncbi:MAG: signal peptidase I [Pseudomonadota bacterium]